MTDVGTIFPPGFLSRDDLRHIWACEEVAFRPVWAREANERMVKDANSILDAAWKVAAASKADWRSDVIWDTAPGPVLARQHPNPLAQDRPGHSFSISVADVMDLGLAGVMLRIKNWRNRLL